MVSVAQQSNIGDEMSPSENTSSSTAMIKDSFSAWLSNGHAKKYSPEVYLSYIDKVSAYLIRRKISTVDLWQLTNYDLFKSVYDKAVNDKLFRAMEKKTHDTFVQVGQAYLKFLKSKPVIHNTPTITLESPIQSSSQLTIKEAIIRVLENEQTGLTPKQIYNKIIENQLYSFRAKNPKAIVCSEIIRACENSKCTIRAPKNHFKFEINSDGKRVYSLLTSNIETEPEYAPYIDSDEIGQTNQESKETGFVVETDIVLKLLGENYQNGFRFDTTTVRLLADKAGIDINNEIQNALKSVMFRRNDDLFFHSDTVADVEIRNKIIRVSENWIADFSCFEISELYELFNDNLNKKCINSLECFETFYEFINKQDIRCVKKYGTRIARIQGLSLNDIFVTVTRRIMTLAHEEFSGVISEYDLRTRFPSFSVILLENIIKEHAEELVRTEINGVVCYQTLDALGLSEEFGTMLAETLSTFDELRLIPSEEALHTAISLRMGVNFKAEYNIPDDKTYRRLIAAYYKNAPRREWKRGIFAEVAD